MKRIPSLVLTAVAITGSLVLVRECGYRAGAQTARLASRDDSLRAVIRRTHAVSDSTQRVYKAQRDSTGRVIRGLLARQAKPVDTPPVNGIPLTPVPDVRDSLITSLLAGRAQDSLQILFLRGQIAQRDDTLIPRLAQARDAWRAQAERPSYVISDIGGGLIAGWGASEKNATVVAVGAGVILLPRVYGAIRRIFLRKGAMGG